MQSKMKSALLVKGCEMVGASLFGLAGAKLGKIAGEKLADKHEGGKEGKEKSSLHLPLSSLSGGGGKNMSSSPSGGGNNMNSSSPTFTSVSPY